MGGAPADTGGAPAGTGGAPAGTGGAPAGTGGAGAAPSVDSIAMLYSAVPSSAHQSMWWELDNGNELDPSTLIIALSTPSESCASPLFDVEGQLSGGLIIVALTPAQQQPGTYDFSATKAWSYMWLGDGTEGGGGGGQITSGSIQILSIDATHVEYKLTGVNPPQANWTVSVDGSHIAERCQ